MNAFAQGNVTGKRLVIFGCGYVGSELARQGLVRGWRVTALTRNEERATALRAEGVETVVADLAGNDWHGRIAGGADAVVNCVSSGGGGLDGYRHSYLEGMTSMLAWARTRGAAHTLVYTSSTSVYPQDGGAGVDETAPTDGAGERAEVLVAAENRLRENRGACARWFILRLAGIYGPGRHRLLEQIRQGEVAGRGDYRLNLVHRADICTAVWAAIDAPPDVADVIFNVVDDAPTPKAVIAEWLAPRLGVSAPRFTGGPSAGRRAVTPDRMILNARIKRTLGWSPRYPSFREGYESILSR